MSATETQTDFRDLVKRAIKGLCQRPPSRRSGYAVLRAKVGQRFGLGSTSAHRLCVELGFDPDMRVKK